MSEAVYPDSLGQIFALAALIVFALTSLAAILATSLITRNNLFYLGTQLILFALALRMSADWIFSFGLAAFFSTRMSLLMFADTLALASLAFTIEMGLRIFVWRRILLKSGRQAVPPLLVGAVGFFIYLLCFLTIVQFVFGQSVTALATVSGALAVILGLSAQSTLGEMFAGIAIALSRPLRIGDWVKIGQLDEGRVKNMTWRLVQIETRDKNIINVTNRVVADSPIRNFSYPNSVIRIKELFYFPVGHDIATIQRTLVAAIADVPEITRNPAPAALYRGNKEGGAEFSLRYYVRDYGAKDKATENVWKAVIAALAKAGLHHTFPRRQVEVQSSSPAGPAAAAAEDA